MRAALRRAPLVLAAVSMLTACDGILDVDQSGIIVPADVDAAGPAGVAPLVNGIVGNYQEAIDDVVRYTSLLTDEMISASTFPTRLEVDGRHVQPSNTSVTSNMYTPLHQAREYADTAVFVFQAKLRDPAYGTVIHDLNQGIALGKLYGGYARLGLGEIYCWSILTGMYPETAPLLPDVRVRQAITFFREAQAAALAEGLTDVRRAALVGEARASLWLRDFNQAAALAGQIPRDFAYFAEYSHNSPSQYNEVYTVTWGDQSGISWTVGDGTKSTRGNEKWEFLDAFSRLGLVKVRPDGFRSDDSSIPVVLQELYNQQESGLLLASGLEAQLIRAEVAVRTGQTATAAQLLNDLRSDFSLRLLLRSKVPFPAAADQLRPLTLTGNMKTDLKTVANERARELWLTGDRLTTSRRLRVDGINLFPPVKAAIGGGDDTAFPIPQRELDHNPNLDASQACPAGQAIGAWH